MNHVRTASAAICSAVLMSLMWVEPNLHAAPPNILFILTDDQRWDAVGYAGNPTVRTPHLDRLAEQGARFDQFYVASPVCNPSRVNFLTGRYTHEGVMNQRNPFRPFIEPGTPTVAAHLNRAGYHTGFIGKAHLDGDPFKWDFKEVPVVLPNAEGGAQHLNPPLIVNGKEQTVVGHVTQIFADAAIRFIDDHQNQPWFLWLATTAPHTPYHRFDEYPYPPETIQPPPLWPKDQPFKVIPRFAEWDAYYSTVSMLDEQIGRILARLDELGLAENTVVFFVSDNGIMHTSHGHLWKAIWYEESSLVPALIRWPGRIQPGTRIASPAVSVDVLPTLLEVAGREVPKGLKGMSLLPALQGRTPLRDAAFSECFRLKGHGGGNWQMIRQGDWKYVEFTDLPEKHLYNLKVDPHETENRIDAKETEEAYRHLSRRLADWRKPLVQ